MEKEFLEYDEALALKELGFNETCFAFYDAYNGDSHLFFNLRGESHWLVRVINALRNKKEQSVIETSQYHLEYLEGDNAVLAPLYQQAFKFFREKHGLDHEINKHKNFDSFMCRYGQNGLYEIIKEGIETYEEAELECLKKLIEIVKTK